MPPKKQGPKEDEKEKKPPAKRAGEEANVVPAAPLKVPKVAESTDVVQQPPSERLPEPNLPDDESIENCFDILRSVIPFVPWPVLSQNLAV